MVVKLRKGQILYPGFKPEIVLLAHKNPYIWNMIKIFEKFEKKIKILLKLGHKNIDRHPLAYIRKIKILKTFHYIHKTCSNILSNPRGSSVALEVRET